MFRLCIFGYFIPKCCEMFDISNVRLFCVYIYTKTYIGCIKILTDVSNSHIYRYYNRYPSYHFTFDDQWKMFFPYDKYFTYVYRKSIPLCCIFVQI